MRSALGGYVAFTAYLHNGYGIAAATVQAFTPALAPVGTIALLSLMAGLGIVSAATLALVAQVVPPPQSPCRSTPFRFAEARLGRAVQRRKGGGWITTSDDASHAAEHAAVRGAGRSVPTYVCSSPISPEIVCPGPRHGP